MLFPEATRVVYRKNPLDRVICQLRFPPILRVDAEVPAAFQERIRAEYPGFAETAGMNLKLPEGMPSDFATQVLGRFLESSPVKNYQFSSLDTHWQINLSRTFVALTTTHYERWEQFRTRLNEALDALQDIYAPTIFSRIGLRYINVIRRSELGLANTAWSELLKPPILGMLSLPELAGSTTGFETRHEVQLADEMGTVRIVTRFAQRMPNNEMCYVIDSDFYCQAKTQIGSVMPKLDFFNQQARHLIQWCITERLHQAMQPEEIC